MDIRELRGLSPQLEMIADLENFDAEAEISLEDGYSLREFRDCPEDVFAWNHIIVDSFNDPAISFDKLMRADPEYRPERIFFICFGNKPVATAAAWFVPDYGEECGVIHMVGAMPEHSGKKLGVNVVRAAMRKLKNDGRTFARLKTDDFRLPAVKSYLRLGFRPLIADENQPDRWKRIYDILGWQE